MTEQPIHDQPSLRRVVLLERDDPVALALALPRALFGWKVLVRRVDRARPGTQPSLLYRLCRAEPLSSRHLADRFDYLAYYQTMAQTAEWIIDQPFCRDIRHAASNLLPGVRDADDKLRITLFVHLCMGLEGYAQSLAVAEALRGGPRVHIIPSINDTVALCAILSPAKPRHLSSNGALTVLRFIGGLAPRLGSLAVGLAVKLLRRASRGSGQRGPQFAPGPGPAGVAADPTNGKVIVLPHQGLAFGDLFAKDYLFRDDPDHPMHSDRAVIIEYDAPETAHPRAQRLTGAHPIGAVARQLVRAFAARRILPLGCARLLFTARVARTIVSIARWKAFLGGFSNASVMVIGYDVHCPKELVIGAQANGIHCIALQERNIMAFAPIYPLILDEYLVSGTRAAEALKRNRNVVIDKITEVGPIRADWLQKRTSGPRLRAPGKKTILVLDAASFPEDGRPDLPSMVSWENNRLFLEDALALARRFPEHRFILRGKDLRWTTIPYFADLLQAIEDCPNFELNRTYDRLRVSYELVDASDLVICRHTSLGDEALSAGVPTVFHERTVSGNIWMRSTCDYDGFPVYTTTLDELATVVERITNDQPIMPPESFRELQARYFNGTASTPAREIFKRRIDALLADDRRPEPAMPARPGLG